MAINFNQLKLNKEAEDGRRYSTREVAQATGLAPNTINAWIQGRVSRFDLETTRKLCDWLGCRLEDLIQHEPTE